MAEDGAELSRIRRERDLYRRLLDLGRTEELEPFLREALGVLVEVTGADQGYVELHEETDAGSPRWWFAHGLTEDEVAGVRVAISRGIIAEALATGRTVVTASAVDDPRFGARESVRIGQIHAVLCAPIGDDEPRGVVYLQRRGGPGAFGEDHRVCAETCARHLAPLVDRLLAHERDREASDPTAAVRARLRLDGLVGRSAGLAKVLEQVALVVPLDVTVLLTGETGTGKSQLARVIHDNGPRATGPFVTLNCAALPETLIESELFGALQGAHSTASKRTEGKVAAAEGGTLLLDEVSELSPAAQAKLLQLLQSKEYYPLGGNRPVRANVRLIAATNTDLRQAVTEHRFREDLLYRLEVLPIRVPALAERREDVPLLATWFCGQAAHRHGLPRVDLSRNVLRALEAAEWPGNVRQLEHAVEAAAIRAAGARARQVEPVHVFTNGAAPAPETVALTFQEATRRFQGTFLREALESYGWNVVETARRLDVARSHLYNLIRAFNLGRDRR